MVLSVYLRVILVYFVSMHIRIATTMKCGHTTCDVLSYCCSDVPNLKGDLNCCCSIDSDVRPLQVYCNYECKFPWYYTVTVVSVGMALLTIAGFKCYTYKVKRSKYVAISVQS